MCVGLIAPEFVCTTNYFSCVSKVPSKAAVILTILQVALVAFRQMLRAPTLDRDIRDLTGHPTSQLDHGSRRSRLHLPQFLKKMLGSPPITTDTEDICSIDMIYEASIMVTRTQVERPCGTPPKRLHPWTRVHSYFSLMGGFIFERDHFHPAVFDYCVSRLILTEFGVRKLARHAPSILPDISKASILDKSKADGFAKVFVCIQAVWFIAQTVGRMASGLPISLLELNTLLHALCCLFVYLAWMSKPMGIELPHAIPSSDGLASKIRAWMTVKDNIVVSRISCLDRYQIDAHGARSISPRFRLVYEEDLAIGYDDEANQAAVDKIMTQIERSRECNREHTRPTELLLSNHNSHSSLVYIDGCPGLKLYPGQAIYGFVVYDVCAEVDGTMFTTLELAYIECLRLAQELRLEKRIGNTWHFGPADSDLFLSYGSSIAEYRTSLYESDQTRFLQAVFDNYVLVTGVLVIGSLYGSIYLIAWNGPFSTGKEQLAWKISCFLVASPGIAALLFMIIELATVKTTLIL